MKIVKIRESQKSRLFEAYREGFSFEELSSLSSDGNAQFEYCRKWLGEPDGSGSSRCVFTLSDNIILKLAMGKMRECGIAQNLNEFKVFNAIKSPLLARLYDVDDNFTYLVCESVLPCEESDFEEVLGMPFYNKNDIFVNHDNPCVYDILCYIESCYVFDEGTMDKKAESIINNNAWFKELCRVVREARIGDFCDYGNFGLVNRNGTPSIVLLDSGLNLDIWNEYYDNEDEYGSY